MNKTILVLAVLLMATSVMAAAPNWDITGQWAMTFTCTSGCGGDYPHTMTVNVESLTTGAFSGTGYYNPGSPTWTVTGTVEANNVNFLISYDGSSYTVQTTSGAIALNGLSMSGAAYGPGQTFTWTATGNAINLDPDHDGVPDTADFCPSTATDTATTMPGYLSLGTNRWIWNGASWTTTAPKGGGTGPTFKPNMTYTYGCSCAQILNYLHTNYPETYGSMLGLYKYGCTQGLLQDWHNGLYDIETVAVPAIQTTPTYSTIPLQNGKNYELKAYGTANAGDGITFDAKYSFRTGSSTQWTNSVSTYESYGPNLLDLYVNGVNVDWGAYNSAHTYWLPITGTGSQLPLQVYDIYYPNNAGNIYVDIYAKLW